MGYTSKVFVNMFDFSGVVRDSVTEVALTGVPISYGSVNATTDSKGEFRLSAVPCTNDYLVVSPISNYPGLSIILSDVCGKYNTSTIFLEKIKTKVDREYPVELEATTPIFRRKGKSSIRSKLRDLQRHATAEAVKNTTTIYKHTLKALLKEFNELQYLSSENKIINVRCIHANPERAVAKIFQEDNIILPIMSISQLYSDNDPDRRRYDSLLAYETHWDEDTNRAIRVISTVPRPINIVYGLNIWTKYMSDMDQLSEQIRLRFNPGLETIQTPYNSLTKAFLATETDGKIIQTGDREDRLIQKTFQMEVQTYANPAKFLFTHTGKIETFNTEISLSDESGEDIVLD